MGVNTSLLLIHTNVPVSFSRNITMNNLVCILSEIFMYIQDYKHTCSIYTLFHILLLYVTIFSICLTELSISDYIDLHHSFFFFFFLVSHCLYYCLKKLMSVKIFFYFQETWGFFLNFRILFIFLYSRFLLVIYYIHISVCMSIPISQFITPPPPCHCSPLVSIRLFSTSVPLFLPCKPVHLYHFSRFHIYALKYDICFSLSDLLHSVWQSLDPFTSLQMTQFRSFLWLSNIPLYICTTSSLSIRLLMGI